MNTHRLFLSISLILISSFSMSSAAEEDNINIAVVGGTSFGAPEKFGAGLVEEDGFIQIETPFGLGPKLYKMSYKGVPFYYVRMYGYETKQPGENDGNVHVRTWYSLYKAGVTHAIGGASSGAIRTDYDYDDIVIIDDFMIMENQRPQDILDYAGIERPGLFPSFATPFSPSLRNLLIEEARKAQEGYSGKLWEYGTFFQNNPGRFETAAEIRAMRILGGEITSLNVGTCTEYARQLGIRWATICSIANPAVGVRPFSFKDMQDSVQRIAAHAIPIVLETIARIPEDGMEPEPISTGEVFTGSYTDPDAKSDQIIDGER
jgi:5'-methylthioadenosine phosphorylase